MQLILNALSRSHPVGLYRFGSSSFKESSLTVTEVQMVYNHCRIDVNIGELSPKDFLRVEYVERIETALHFPHQSQILF